MQITVQKTQRAQHTNSVVFFCSVRVVLFVFRIIRRYHAERSWLVVDLFV